MEAHAEELALLETLDTGKPIRHSLRYDIPARRAPFAGTPKRSTKCMAKWRPPVAMSWHDWREPVGVIAAIVPWNFPLLLTCWKLGPALAAEQRDSKTV